MDKDQRHAAFVDLEEGLIKTMGNAWLREWAPLAKKITKAVSDNDFDKAHALVDEIDPAPVFERSRKRLNTFGKASMLMGADEVSPEGNQVAGNPRTDLISNAMTQLDIMFVRNATQVLRQQAHNEVTKSEQEKGGGTDTLLTKAGDVVSVDSRTRVKLNVLGKSYFALGASMHLNRLRSLGFLHEAVLKGSSQYQIDAVRDNRTSDICNALHGKIFSVEEGLTKIEQSLGAADPDSLKSIQPWPKANKDNVQLISRASSADLSNMGLALPPYHPLCRTVITLINSNLDVEFTPADSGSLMNAGLSFLGGAALAQALFGQLISEDQPDIIPDEDLFQDVG